MPLKATKLCGNKLLSSKVNFRRLSRSHSHSARLNPSVGCSCLLEWWWSHHPADELSETQLQKYTLAGTFNWPRPAVL